ncbi:MAG: peptide chain release factor 1 [Verrucomicrobia bacterium]|nr:peptide chain release factor 1 [Verrucomicrobiota bacterium]MCF7707456.1 peptide chain release factor 1 [Verrucomicrobiota bacterium]
MDFRIYIDRFKERYAQVEHSLSDPKVFNDQQQAQELGREYARLKELVRLGDEYVKVQDDIAANRELHDSEPVGSELGELAAEELPQLESRLEHLEFQLKTGLVPPDPTDSRNTIIEIRAGAGGMESALFVADLYRAYSRYAEANGWKTEAMNSNPSDLGGFKEIIFSVSGTDVYKKLKYESGVHRVQRVPATETQGRIHTSTVTVAVLPEAQEVDVQIQPDEIEVSICRASGPGGQGVNTTDSAVQIHHKPTGMIVRCSDERSQLKNKAKALLVLRSRLLEHRIAEENAKYAAQRKAQVGTGERNERIRTYNFPQNRVTDHRIELTLHSLPAVMEGDFDALFDAMMAADMEEKIAEATV